MTVIIITRIKNLAASESKESQRIKNQTSPEYSSVQKEVQVNQVRDPVHLGHGHGKHTPCISAGKYACCHLKTANGSQYTQRSSSAPQNVGAIIVICWQSSASLNREIPKTIFEMFGARDMLWQMNSKYIHLGFR